MQVQFSKTFKKHYVKAPFKVQKAFDIRLKLFIEDPLNGLLRNHALTGELSGLRSINVTGDWRALYEDMGFIDMDRATFVAIGTYSQLYH